MRIEDRRGFTLLELVVVVAIIGLLASIALIPNLFRFQKRAAASKAASSIAQIISAFELAGSEGCTSLDLKSGEPLACQTGVPAGTIYLQAVPSPPSNFKFWCLPCWGTDWRDMATDGCKGSYSIDPTKSVDSGAATCPATRGLYHLRAQFFLNGDIFYCSQGSCFCSTYNPISPVDSVNCASY